VSITPWVWRMRVRQSGRIYDIRKFGSNDAGIALEPGRRIDMAYSLQPDRWRRAGFAVAFEAARPAV
jgi:hypothetical protein